MFYIKSILTGGALALGFSAPVIASETINLSAFTWPGAVVTQSIVKEIVESRLGHTVEYVSVDIAAGMAAMCKGDGSIDIQVDFWMPNHQEKWNKFIGEGSKNCVHAGSNPYAGTQGFFVPGYLQEEFDIRDVNDLNNPEIANLFDSDGDGKGEWWPGPAGWGSTNIGMVKAQTYGFDKGIETLVVSEAAFKAKLEADYARKKPILFFYWTPEWLFAKYDLRLLNEPEFDGYAMANKVGEANYNSDGCWNMIQPSEDPDWLSKSSVSCAFPDASIYVTYSSEIKERAPDVALLMDGITLNADLVSNLILQMEVDNRDPEEIAATWVAENAEIVDGWLAGK